MIRAQLIAALLFTSAAAHAYDIEAELSLPSGEGFKSSALQLGLQVGKDFDRYRGEAYVNTNKHGDRSYGVDGLLPLTTFMNADLSAKAGVLYNQSDDGSGFGLKVGVEAEYPLAKSFSAVGEVFYLRHQSSISGLDGTKGLIGLRYKF